MANTSTTSLPPMGGASPLPREIIKWLQSLDLSFIVKNPKRDFSNGFLVAEMLSRYYPKDIDVNTFENGSRLAAKINNWEQIYRFARKHELSISKQEIDPVIHCSENGAVFFLYHLYEILTMRQLRPTPQNKSDDSIPAFMRDTASKRLKTDDIARIQDDVERTIRAIDVLGGYHEERRQQRAVEAPLLIQQERRTKAGIKPEAETSLKEEAPTLEQVSEVRVKALVTGEGGPNRMTSTKPVAGPKITAKTRRAELLKAVCNPASSMPVTALTSGSFVKPAVDIMRPLVLAVIQDEPELEWLHDSGKDVMVMLLEHSREGHKQGVLEQATARAFEALAQRASLLIDTLTKSPQEFWKVWSTLFPAISAFSEASALFDSAVYFFKRLGELMREVDPNLTQQLLIGCALTLLTKELVRSPEKRDCLCDIIYSYCHEDTMNHLLVLKALKDQAQISDNTSVYIACLSSLVSIDDRMNLLDEHLLDLYVYYALVGMQHQQPRVRVSGLAILATLAAGQAPFQTVLALIPQCSALGADDWWEVQAQLLLLSSALLQKILIAEQEGDYVPPIVFDQENTDGYPEEMHPQDALLNIISKIFVVSGSKNVLQVGLSALAPHLSTFPAILPMFVAVLLEQPAEYRTRLLRGPEGDHPDQDTGKKTYVWGNTSRLYEERRVTALWPSLDVAKAVGRQIDASEQPFLGSPGLEVLAAAVPEQCDDIEIDEWVNLFEQVKGSLFHTMLDPDLSTLSGQVIRRFWSCRTEGVSTGTLDASKKPLLQALEEFYGKQSQRPLIDEARFLDFLGSSSEDSAMAKIEIGSALEAFKEVLPQLYRGSGLHRLR